MRANTWSAGNPNGDTTTTASEKSAAARVGIGRSARTTGSSTSGRKAACPIGSASTSNSGVASRTRRRRRRQRSAFESRFGTARFSGPPIAASRQRQSPQRPAPSRSKPIVAARETACRWGELLSLRWFDVSLQRGELTIRAENAKDADLRVLPISSRLAAVLNMAKTDPAGKDYKPDDYVSGELGKRTANIKRAWETCVLESPWLRTDVAERNTNAGVAGEARRDRPALSRPAARGRQPVARSGLAFTSCAGNAGAAVSSRQARLST